MKDLDRMRKYYSDTKLHSLGDLKEAQDLICLTSTENLKTKMKKQLVETVVHSDRKKRKTIAIRSITSQLNHEELTRTSSRTKGTAHIIR